MDIVLKRIPRWAWEGINRCRLFLQVNTVADIATVDGKYIPRQIREVTGKLRESKLLFPVQPKPCKEDIAQWAILIQTLSANGHLFVPLGHWIRSPDQKHQYMITDNRQIVYKHNSTDYIVFQRVRLESRRMRRIRINTTTIPSCCTPVRVIQSAKYLVVLDDHECPTIHRSSFVAKNLQQQTLREHKVLGKYSIDDTAFQRLRTAWNQPRCTLVCATDGGLKDKIGTSSHAFFFPGEINAIISGRTSIFQPWKQASSTRQELLGQLGIDYWISRLCQQWGTPRYTVNITLITDSQASIDILQTACQLVGIKDTLRPEIDVVLEILRLRQTRPWIAWNIHKVESHINKNAAPDEIFWECNELVDALATKGRQDYSLEDLQQREDLVFLGTRIGCKIDGRVVNNSLYSILKEKITGTSMRFYLLEKYHWTTAIFDDIAWDAHQKILKKTPHTKRVTLLKYIHGWLPTNKRRFRECRVPLGECALCGQVESQDHFLRCTNTQMQNIREPTWKELMTALVTDTEPGFKVVFTTGLSTVLGGQSPSAHTINDWPPEMRSACTAQSNIGWNQVLFGRISSQWETVANFQNKVEVTGSSSAWTSRAIHLCWGFGLELWRARNHLIHGTIEAYPG